MNHSKNIILFFLDARCWSFKNNNIICPLHSQQNVEVFDGIVSRWSYFDRSRLKCQPYRGLHTEIPHFVSGIPLMNTRFCAGGCYSSYPKGFSFSNAQTTCASEGGIIAVDHDGKKGEFLNRGEFTTLRNNRMKDGIAVLIDSSSKSDYFWIGFSKSDDGSWKREDKVGLAFKADKIIEEK